MTVQVTNRIDQLRAEMRDGLLRVAAATRPTPLGDLWLRHEVDPFDGSSEVRVGRAADHLDTVLLRSRDQPGPRPTIEWAVPSPTGAHIAVGICAQGDEDATIRVIDVATGALLPDAVPHSLLSPVAWCPDGSGFYAKVGPAPAQAMAGPLFTVLHQLGGRTERIDEASGNDVAVTVEANGDVVAVGGAGAAVAPIRIRRAAGGEWLPLLEGAGTNCIGSVHGDSYVAVVNDVDRGRVVAIPLGSPQDRSSWRELVPEGAGVLRGVTALDAHLVTFEIRDGAHRVRVFRWEQAGRGPAVEDHEVPLPEPSGLDLLFGFGQGNGEPRIIADGPTTVSFHLGGFDRPPCPMRYDVVGRALVGDGLETMRDDRIVASRHHAVSSDGALTGYWHVRLRATVGPAPALVYGYGGFNIAMHTPCHPTQLMPWLERGGCLLLPQLRGGGEQGLDHWLQGSVPGKQRTYDDLYAVVEHATTLGLVDAARVGFVGVSNGGLTAGVAITQQPALFRAVVCAIPVIDLVNFPDTPLDRLFGLYGGLDDPVDRAERAALSPLHHVRADVVYPSVLVDVGEVDVRCPAGPGLAFAERLREVCSPSRRVVVNHRPYGGHVTPEGEVWPVWLDFLLSELLDDGPTP